MTTTVLIVDDHETFRATARLLLELEGFDVIGEADNGESAVLKAAELTPDLIVLDVQLPDINGFEVARRVCRDGQPPAIIMVSSHEDSDYGPLVATSCARGFVTKAELSGERVRALLGGGNP